MAETNPFLRHRNTSRENLSQSQAFDAQNPFGDNAFIPFNLETSTSNPTHNNTLAPPPNHLHGSLITPPLPPPRRSRAPILTVSPDQDDEATLIAKALLLEHQKAREQELLDEALARRLQLEYGDDPVPQTSNSASLDQHIAQQLADEELARRIQEEEELGGGSMSMGQSIRTPTPETNADEILARSLADEDYARSLAEADGAEASQQRRPSGSSALNGFAPPPPPVGTSSPYPPYRPPPPPAPGYPPSGYPPYRPPVGYSPNSFAPQQPTPPRPPPTTAPRFNYFPTTSSQPATSQTSNLPPRGPRNSPGASPTGPTDDEVLARQLADLDYARVARPPPLPPAVPSRPPQQELDEAPPAYEAVPTEGTTLPVPAALLPPSSDASGSTTVSISERLSQEERDAEMARRLASMEASEPGDHFASLSRLGPPVPPKIKRLIFTKLTDHSTAVSILGGAVMYTAQFRPSHRGWQVTVARGSEFMSTVEKEPDGSLGFRIMGDHSRNSIISIRPVIATLLAPLKFELTVRGRVYKWRISATPLPIGGWFHAAPAAIGSKGAICLQQMPGKTVAAAYMRGTRVLDLSEELFEDEARRDVIVTSLFAAIRGYEEAM